MPRFTIWLAVVSVACSVSVEAADKRAFEIADYYRTAFVGAPVISPDGTRVVFEVKRYELETATSWSELWIMAADGSDLRQLTRGRHQDSSPVFSPDGATLAFLSSRDDHGQQIYLLPMGGGEARRLTAFPGGVSAPVWSPAGTHLAVTAEVYPECGADADCNATIRDAVAAGPLKAYMTDELLFRHWNSWREGRFPHVLLVDITTGAAVRDLTPGRWDSPTFSAGGGPGYAFSPDGRELCVVSNHDPVPATSTNSDLWLVDPAVEGVPKPATNITADNPGWDGDPVYSPDGRFIAFRSQARAGRESDLFRLAVYDRVNNRVRTLSDSGSFDNWVESVRWGADGDVLYFSAQVAGVTPLFRIGSEGGKITRLHDDGAIAGWQLTPDGETIVYNRSKVGQPPELLAVPSGGGSTDRLTRFNRDLSEEVDIRSAEVIWVEGDGGRRIQVFLVKPHDFDPSRKDPLILDVHGGPQSPWKDRYRGDWQVYPGKGYVVAFPNPTGSAGFGQDNVDAISCDYGGKV